MLILLPPSEGKTPPSSGSPLDLAELSSPELTRTRERILKALVTLSGGRPKRAMEILGLGPTQAAALTVNATLPDQPTASAAQVYTGVLYGELGLTALSPAGRARATREVRITSSLFGLVAPDDSIPAYRLAGTVTLPRLGPVPALWRAPLGRALDDLVGDGLLLDLRSGTYAGFHTPRGPLAERTATMRVLHEHHGARKVVSHFNKATKGRIVRALLESDATPRTVDDLTDAMTTLGWTVERADNRLDVVVAEV